MLQARRWSRELGEAPNQAPVAAALADLRRGESVVVSAPPTIPSCRASAGMMRPATLKHAVAQSARPVMPHPLRLSGFDALQLRKNSRHSPAIRHRVALSATNSPWLRLWFSPCGCSGRRWERMHSTISVMNAKGGVGKSTLVLTLAETLSACHGKRVLVIDSDAHASISNMLMRPDWVQTFQARAVRWSTT